MIRSAIVNYFEKDTNKKGYLMAALCINKSYDKLTLHYSYHSQLLALAKRHEVHAWCKLLSEGFRFKLLFA